MSESEPNKPQAPDEPIGDDKEDYGAKGADQRDEPSKQPDEIPVPEAD
jgi:hypothetical protein